VIGMDEAFEAEMVRVAAAIFLTVVMVWVLYSQYFLSLFEAAVSVASAIVVAAFFVTRLIKSNYNDFLEENNAQNN
jgi:hypothetical protein